MFAEAFSHYLTYGAADQQTVRELAGTFTGLVVPGTVAAFQREGTGGFVLSLSAMGPTPQYVIDPRFPLFQQALLAPKRSHVALAELLGARQLVSAVEPAPTSLDDALIGTIAQHWAQFNLQYQESVRGKFDKYAERLGEPVQPEHARGPSYILPPYTIAGGVHDPWWDVAGRLYEATVRAVGGAIECVRVVAVTQPNALGDLLGAVGEGRNAIWVSGLDELSSDTLVLAEYLSAIEQAARSGIELFALYGGFFSVLASSVGLRGSCHGIGYGEYRNWLELPTSGPPPARYYLPQIHRYVPQDFAYKLWLEDRKLAECTCQECQGQPPMALDYHSLMKHSVRCRAIEIDQWTELSLEDMAERLHAERIRFLKRVQRANLPDLLRADALKYCGHLEVWSDALEQVA